MITIPDKFIDKCVAEFDADVQLDILQEECAELIQAISKMKRNETTSTENMVEGIARVLMSIGVVARLYNISQRAINWEVRKKCEQYDWDADELIEPSPAVPASITEAVVKAAEAMNRLGALLDGERERTKYEC